MTDDQQTVPDVQTIPVIGYGAIGREVTQQLLEKGYKVRVIQRREPRDLPDGATFTAADAMDAAALAKAVGPAKTIIYALGLPYDSKVWLEGWPRALAAILTACEKVGARMVYTDSMYLYGPKDQPLTEDMPPVDYGQKPKARAMATRLWQKAFEEGRVKTVAVRAPDFYGPGVATSILGATTFGRIARGKSAQVLISADHPHDIVHIRDFSRALITLAEAPDDAYGQAWHVPSPPTKTLREYLQFGADALGQPLKITVLPGWLAKIIGLFNPLVHEAMDLHFLMDRPHLVNSEKFKERFWSDVMPLEESIAETVRSFQN